MGYDGRDAEVLLIDGRLIVLAHGAYLGAKGDELIVRRRKKELGRYPLATLSLVLLDGLHQSIATDAQIACADRGVTMAVIGSGGRPAGVFEPVASRRTTLRAQQVLQRDAPGVIRAGLEMLTAKVGNQAALLKYFAKYKRRTGSAAALPLARAAAEVQDAARRIASLDLDTRSLRAVAMGHEGRGAAAYWRGFACLLPAALGFRGRATRGAGDPVNQCLNYVYGVLYGETWRAVVSHGLDPYFGVMHGGTRDEGSLVFDLIEELRAPFADRVVAALIGRGFVVRRGRYGGLSLVTRRVLARAFLRGFTQRPVRRGTTRTTGEHLLHGQIRDLVATVEERGRYRGYRMQW